MGRPYGGRRCPVADQPTPIAWTEALDLVMAAMAHTLRGDETAARATLALVPGSMLRGALLATLQAWAGSLVGRHADPEHVGELLAAVFCDAIVSDPAGGGE